METGEWRILKRIVVRFRCLTLANIINAQVYLYSFFSNEKIANY